MSAALTPLPEVQTAASMLFRRAPRLTAKALCEALNTRLAKTGHDARVHSNDEEIELIVCATPIRFKRVANRISPDALLRPRMASATSDRLKTHDRLIENHRGYVEIVVGDEPMRIETFDQPLLSSDKIEELSPLNRRLRLLFEAVMAVMEIAIPRLILWRQSDMLFSPDEMLETEGLVLPTPLTVRLEPLRSDGRAPGVRVDGSMPFLGKTLAIDAQGLGLERKRRIAASVLLAHQAGRIELAHGTVLETKGGETFRVRHEPPDARDATGRICLGKYVPRQHSRIISPIPAPGTVPSPDFAQRLERIETGPEGTTVAKDTGGDEHLKLVHEGEPQPSALRRAAPKLMVICSLLLLYLGIQFLLSTESGANIARHFDPASVSVVE